MEKIEKISRLSGRYLVVSALAFVLFATLLSLGLGLILPKKSNPNKDASIIPAGWNTANYKIHKVSEQPLFTKGGINYTIAQQLLDITETMEPGTRTAANFSTKALSLQGLSDSATQPGAIYIRLFDYLPELTDPVAGTYTTPATLSSFTGNATIGARWWQVVYMDDNTITLWMADGYRNSAFGSDNAYTASSTVRINLIADFDAVLTSFPQGVKDAIITPNLPDMGNVYRANYNATSTTQQFANPATPAGDKVFLPSIYEVSSTSRVQMAANTESHVSVPSGILENNGIRGGQWQLNGFDRGHDFSAATGGFSNVAWLRSCPIGSASVGFVSGPGVAISDYGAASLESAVRPALVISKTSLHAPSASYSAGFDGESAASGRVTALSSGDAPATEIGETALAVDSPLGEVLLFNAGVNRSISQIKIETMEGDPLVINIPEVLGGALEPRVYVKDYGRFTLWHSSLASPGQQVTLMFTNVTDDIIITAFVANAWTVERLYNYPPGIEPAGALTDKMTTNGIDYSAALLAAPPILGKLVFVGWFTQPVGGALVTAHAL